MKIYGIEESYNDHAEYESMSYCDLSYAGFYISKEKAISVAKDYCEREYESEVEWYNLLLSHWKNRKVDEDLFPFRDNKPHLWNKNTDRDIYGFTDRNGEDHSWEVVEFELKE